jgi:hypothetical protein
LLNTFSMLDIACLRFSLEMLCWLTSSISNHFANMVRSSVFTGTINPLGCRLADACSCWMVNPSRHRPHNSVSLWWGSLIYVHVDRFIPVK